MTLSRECDVTHASVDAGVAGTSLTAHSADDGGVR
jgi:hypothetical protein